MPPTVLDLGTPLAPTARGGDVRARNVVAARNIYGPHLFLTPGDLSISNGLLRLTIGGFGSIPSVLVSAYALGVQTGVATTYDAVTVYDSTTVYVDDVFAHAWIAMGSIVFDSTSVSALLSNARLVHLTPERATVRLASAAISDVFVTLRRGERIVRIQHGSTRPPFVTIDRRVRWAPAPTGVAYSGRISEDTPAIANSPRFIAARTPGATVSVPFFSVTVPAARTASFGAGVGTTGQHNSPAEMHAQLFDDTRVTISAEVT